jgi:hypothetical protein
MNKEREKLEGQIFNGMRFLSYSHKDKHNNPHYNMKCHCGKEKVINGRSVKYGKTRSCGCLKGLKPGQAIFNSYIWSYKRSAKRRNYDFQLTKEQFKEITSKNCYYCDIEPTELKNYTGDFKGTYMANGVDRVDSSLGYSLENCVACCSICNSMKTYHNYEKFIEKVNRIYNHTQNKSN